MYKFGKHLVLLSIFQAAFVLCVLEASQPHPVWGEDKVAQANAVKSGQLNSDKDLSNAFEFLNLQMDRCRDNSVDPEKKNRAVDHKGYTDAARFVRSYAASQCTSASPEDAAYLYDQALVMLAFLARGLPEDQKRAKIIADAMVSVQKNDRTFKDGRLRNAYMCGAALDGNSGWPRLAGRWNDDAHRFEEDEYAQGSDTGNLAWAGIALIQAHRLLPSDAENKYLKAAVRIAGWIVRQTAATDSLGGFYGGFSGRENAPGNPDGPLRLTWRSTEHNLDLMALFRLLEVEFKAQTAQNRKWKVHRNHALKFVNAMGATEKSGAFLWTGTRPDSTKINQAVIPLDSQTWSVLARHQRGTPNPFEASLEWAQNHCRAKEINLGYDFNCRDGDGAWWEGTAQVAAALKWTNRNASAESILKVIGDAQLQTGPAKGAIPAASKCGLTTGFYKLWRSTGESLPWLIYQTPHVGATAWYIFALLGKNPFFLMES